MDDNKNTTENPNVLQPSIIDGKQVKSIDEILVMPGASDNNLYTTSIGENTSWYYDSQLRNQATSTRLYANSFVDVERSDEKHMVWRYTSKQNGFPYTVLLVSAILNEDFQVDVSNNWDETGSEVVSGVLNNIMKPYAPYAGRIVELLDTAKSYNNELNNDLAGNDETKKKAAQDVRDSWIGKSLNKLTSSKMFDGVTKVAKGVQEISQGVFVTQGASFTTYGGTGVNFGGLSMRFTLFPTWNSGRLVSVNEQLDKLIPYSIGNLEDLNWEKLADEVGKAADEISGDTNVDISSLYKKIQKSVAGSAAIDALNKYIKWQRPPGGFNVNDPLNIDVASFPGTLRLEIGTHYLLDNLVISGMSLQFSKQMMKDPTYFLSTGANKDKLENALTPLYCEVNLLLKPVTKFSQISLLKFIEGNTDSRRDVASKMQKNLKEMREAISGRQNDERYSWKKE